MSAKSRLLEYLSIKGIKNRLFYQATGLSNGFLDKNDNINSDKIETIISKYPDLNVLWLITGQGEMMMTSESRSSPDSKMMERLDKMLETMASQQRTIEVLAKKNTVQAADNAICADVV